MRPIVWNVIVGNKLFMMALATNNWNTSYYVPIRSLDGLASARVVFRQGGDDVENALLFGRRTIGYHEGSSRVTSRHGPTPKGKEQCDSSPHQKPFPIVGLFPPLFVWFIAIHIFFPNIPFIRVCFRGFRIIVVVVVIISSSSFILRPCW